MSTKLWEVNYQARQIVKEGQLQIKFSIMF